MKRTGFLLAATLTVFCYNTEAALQTYPGMNNGVVTPTMIVGGGTLVLSGQVGSSISFTFTRGGGESSTMNNYLVLFLDSKVGGFTGTSSFTDNRFEWSRAVSGLGISGTDRAPSTFASGFGADYAVVINPGFGARLLQLGTGTFTQVGGLLLAEFAGNTRTITFSVGRGALGMSATDPLRFESAYMSGGGSRPTLESFEHFAPGSLTYWNPATYADFNIFEVQPVPEMTNMALVIFGGLVLGARFVPGLRRRLRVGRRPKTS